MRAPDPPALTGRRRCPHGFASINRCVDCRRAYKAAWMARHRGSQQSHGPREESPRPGARCELPRPPRPHAPIPPRRKVLMPDGRILCLCTCCHRPLPADRFHMNGAGSLNPRCKRCRRRPTEAQKEAARQATALPAAAPGAPDQGWSCGPTSAPTTGAIRMSSAPQGPANR